MSNKQKDTIDSYKTSHNSSAIPTPLPGTYAHTAREMAKIMSDFDYPAGSEERSEGAFDWDAWKDEMKDRDLD
jgi:hypothetical protein